MGRTLRFHLDEHCSTALAEGCAVAFTTACATSGSMTTAGISSAWHRDSRRGGGSRNRARPSVEVHGFRPVNTASQPTMVQVVKYEYSSS